MNYIDKYTQTTLKNLNEYNMHKIIDFLQNEKCNYIEDIITDYLDLFTIDYDEFISKYVKINGKYNGNFLSLAAEDMNLFEEIFSDLFYK